MSHAELLNQMQLTMANRLPLSPIQAVGLKTERILQKDPSKRTRVLSKDVVGNLNRKSN